MIDEMGGIAGELSVAARFGAGDEPGPIMLKGWAHASCSPVSKVDVFCNGRRIGRGQLGRVRADIAALLGDEAELSGFEVSLDTRGFSTEPRFADLLVTVGLLDGTGTTLGPIEVPVGPSPAPVPLEPIRQVSAISSPIRLLCVARSMDYGGSQLRLRELAYHLSESGTFALTVLSPSDGPLRADLEAQGVAVEVIRPTPVESLKAYEDHVAMLCDRARGSFDLVFAATLTSFAAVDAANRLGLPAVWRLGEAESFSKVVQWVFGRYPHPAVENRARRAFSTATAVVANSLSAARSQQLAFASGRFAVLGTGTPIPNDLPTRAESRAALGVQPAVRLLVCPATIWRVKGQARLACAVANLVIPHPPLKIVLIGSQAEPDTTALQRFIGREGLTSVVEIRPFGEDLSPWLAAADAVVLPSESESMSTAILEAMAHGLPVLACHVGGNPEVVIPGETGWLCEPDDLGALRDAIKVVATAPTEVLSAFGTNARRRAKRDHDRGKALVQMSELLEAAARGRLPPWFDCFGAC